MPQYKNGSVMDLPALLPKELKYASIAETDHNLFNMLIKIPYDFILFFEWACDDETWSGHHSKFMKEAIQWMTNQYLQDKFSVEMAKKAVAKIQEHSAILDPYVPKNLTFKLSGTYRNESSLLWGASSEFMRNLIRQECRDKNRKSLELDDVVPEVFDQVEEYITTGNVKELWRKDQEEVLSLLELATEWGLTGLIAFCQDQLKKYISRTNAIELLLKAHEEGWGLLKDYCSEFINNLDVGVRFEKSEMLAMEFLNFRADAMEIFEAVRSSITCLACSYNLTEQEGFSDVINRCPALICLDISRSEAFTDRLLDIPPTLQELDVAKCEWLTSKTLKKIVEICPNLVKISLASNSHLTYSFWSILKEFKYLEKLDISRCHQIKDEDFKIILQAAKNVTHFELEECTGLTDNAFFELAKNIPKATDLDVSRTNISDSGLIDLMMRCKHVITLKAIKCPHLTEKGILEAVRNAPNLKLFDVSKNQVSKEMLKEIQEIRPFLKIRW